MKIISFSVHSDKAGAGSDIYNVFKPFSHTQIAFERCCLMKGCCDASRLCGLSYHSIPARVGRDPMTVSRIWNRWVQYGNTECSAGSQRSPITNSREDRHVTRMALIDRAATSRALSQELGSFAR
ncbi:HTH_Tnp_Tc3_2 domain-containing protein [Trichonephila clavipes]|nr:HTH_Tnp_Tc3_2 domain-containing protein [Trichonephila clavipes]